MNFIELQKYLIKTNKDKKVEFTFDDNCMKKFMLNLEEGCACDIHQIECDKVLVKIEGLENQYIPIGQYFFNITHEEMIKFISRIRRCPTKMNIEENKTLPTQDLAVESNQQ